MPLRKCIFLEKICIWLWRNNGYYSSMSHYYMKSLSMWIFNLSTHMRKCNQNITRIICYINVSINIDEKRNNLALNIIWRINFAIKWWLNDLKIFLKNLWWLTNFSLKVWRPLSWSFPLKSNARVSNCGPADTTKILKKK